MTPKLIRNVVLAFALFAASPAVFAEPKVPATAEEHFALAKQYQEKAASFHKEAEEHRAMAAAYRNSTANAQDRRGQKNPWVVKMEKHCAEIAATADKLSSENTKAAEYHTFRGKELQGK
jgi:hypothetical protein